MSSLLFAYDVVLMADNADYLQRLINGIAAFSLQWGLVVNTNKAEIMIFSKYMRIISETFTYNNINLKTLDKFVYFEIVFIPSFYTHAEATGTKSQLSTACDYLLKDF